jgi:uncharacterized membrane protein
MGLMGLMLLTMMVMLLLLLLLLLPALFVGRSRVCRPHSTRRHTLYTLLAQVRHSRY